MPRHRGTYKPDREEPYEISRSRIEAFQRCPACFWMDRARGIKFPGMIPFLLNSATDALLKKDFDVYREIQKPHPIMKRYGLGHLVPFAHENLKKWENSLHFGASPDYFNILHEPTNLLFGGGLDDVWLNTKTKELHIVDYKSTSKGLNKEKTALEKINLDGHYSGAYKRQMDMYTWIMRGKGFEVSNKGYFLYVNGDKYFEDGMLNDEGNKAKMMFDVQIIEYIVNTSWIEKALHDVKTCLESDTCPEHAQTGFGYKGDQPCEYLQLFDGMRENGLMK